MSRQKGAPQVELQTTIGTFVVELYVDHAPKTCKNFLGLVDRKYYDGTPFHRIIRVSHSPISATTDSHSQLKKAFDAIGIAKLR